MRKQLDSSLPADATVIVKMEEHVANNLLYNQKVNFKYKRAFVISKSVVYCQGSARYYAEPYM